MNRAKLVPILIIVIAISIAFAAALLAYNKFQNQNKPTIVEEGLGDTLQIAVAKLDLPWGTLIEKGMIRMEPYLKESLPSGYFAEQHVLEGRTLIYPVSINEPIFESSLAPTSASGGIAAVLSPKKRAMSVKVNKVIGISGFISPGNRVDVLVTTQRKRVNSTPLHITKTVLENILVLAIGSEMGKNNKQDKTQKAVDVITLEVTPEEGETLALATNSGTVQLALRNYSDTEEVLTQGSTIKTMLASYSKKETSNPMIKQEFHTVTVIKGVNVNEVMF